MLLLGPTPPPEAVWACRVVWIPLFEAEPIRGASLEVVKHAPYVEAVVFTSPRSPWALRWDAERSGMLTRLRGSLSSLDVWSIGPKTAAAVSRFLGLDSLLPPEYTGRSLAGELVERGYVSVLGVRAPHALRDLALILESNGVEYREVHAYRLRLRRDQVERAREAAGRAHAVVLTSPMIARVALDQGIVRRGHVLVALGPSTAAELERHGRRPDCVPETYVLEEALACAESLLASRLDVLEQDVADHHVRGEE